MVLYTFNRNLAGWLNGGEIVTVPDQIAAAQREHDLAGTVFPVRGKNQDVVMVQLDGEAYGLHTAGTGDIILKDAPRYALIDIHSGFVWGVASAATVLDAVKAVDAHVGIAFPREYVQHSPGAFAERAGSAATWSIRFRPISPWTTARIARRATRSKHAIWWRWSRSATKSRRAERHAVRKQALCPDLCRSPPGAGRAGREGPAMAPRLLLVHLV